MIFKSLGLLLVVGLATCEPPVNNQYLPPPTGYNYPTPAVPFPQPPSPRPPAYRPSPPPPSPPAYRPPPPPPAPPVSRPPPSYGPPSPPPSPPVSRPPPGYGPPPPVNRPPPPPPPPVTRPPAYRPPSPPPSYGPPSYDGVGSSPVGAGHDHDHHHHEPGMPFDFNYAVKDDYYGTDYSHNAVSDGDVVRGQYRVALPDGRVQIVTYTADWKNGFNADVKYEGEAQYPDQQPGYPGPGYPSPQPPKPSYGPPSGPY